MQNQSFRAAQGALEYLMIISVVILIAAVVITALPYLLINPKNELPGVDAALNNMRGFSTIVVNNIEGFIGGNGNAVISLINKQGDSVTLISVDGNKLASSVVLYGGGGNSNGVILPPGVLPDKCKCGAGDTKVSCSLILEFESGEKQQINLNLICLGNNFEITNCLGLQAMDLNLDGNYILKNNIDCSMTKNWNGGNGFLPIGDSTNKFTGDLNGNNFDINALYINRKNTDKVGLIGWAEKNSSVINLNLSDLNITGRYNVGGFFGTLEFKSDETYAGLNLNVAGNFAAVYGVNVFGYGCGNSFGIDPITFNSSGILPAIPSGATESAYGN